MATYVITPETKSIVVNIFARHLQATTDFYDHEHCALARAIQEQLDLTPSTATAGITSVTIQDEPWKISVESGGQYGDLEFANDVKAARGVRGDKLIRAIILNRKEDDTGS